MAYKRWKYSERKVACILEGKRNTEKGVAVEDIKHPWLGIEVKSREKIPEWLISALTQAETNCPEEKLPIVALIEHRGVNLAILRLETFAAWFVAMKEVKD